MRSAKQHVAELAPLRAQIAALYIPCLFFALGIGAAVFIFPLYAFQLGGNVALAGLVLGLKGAGTLLMNFLSGLLVFKFGEKRALLLATSLLFLLGVASAHADSIVALLLSSFAMGAVASLWYLARLKYISDHIPRQIWGRAMSILSGVEKTGLLLAPLIAGYLILLSDHGIAFYITSMAGLVSLILVYRFAECGRMNKRSLPASSLYFIFDILLEKKNLFLTVGLVIVIMLMIRSARHTLLPVWGSDINLDAAEIGQIVFAAGCADLLMFVPAGLILDFLGRKWSALYSFLVLTAGYLTLSLAESYAWLLAVAVLIGLGNGLSTGWANTLVLDFSPAKQREQFLAVWRIVGDSGTLLGPLIVGFLAIVFSLSWASIIIAGFGLAGAGILRLSVEESRQG